MGLHIIKSLPFKRTLFGLVIALLMLFGGSFALKADTTEQSSNTSLKSRIKAYFDIYSQRRNFDAFMAFYADDVVFNDVIFGNAFTSRQELTEFFDWQRGQFELHQPGSILEVLQQTVSGNTAVTRGVFHKFKFDGKEYGPWQFIMWHEFNDAGQIIRHEDWINYTPKTIFPRE